MFWLLIVARGLASLRYQRHYAHVKAMAAYVELALHYLRQTDPDFLDLTRDDGEHDSS